MRINKIFVESGLGALVIGALSFGVFMPLVKSKTKENPVFYGTVFNEQYHIRIDHSRKPSRYFAEGLVINDIHCENQIIGNFYLTKLDTGNSPVLLDASDDISFELLDSEYGMNEEGQIEFRSPISFNGRHNVLLEGKLLSYTKED